MKKMIQNGGFSAVAIAILFINPAYAVDSYRFLHVTIDTPWYIFVFLLFFVLSPFVLMAILAWHFALKKSRAQQRNDSIK